MTWTVKQRAIFTAAATVSVLTASYLTQPATQDPRPPKNNLICVLQSDEGKPKVSGIVKFSQQAGFPVYAKGIVRGLEDGKHGLHVHRLGNLTDGCKSASSHFNPTGRAHGGPDSKEHHAGDLGNIVSRNGSALIDFQNNSISLWPGPFSVLGRTLVVHAKEDDLGQGGNHESLVTGNSGERVACGIIGWDEWDPDTQPGAVTSVQLQTQEESEKKH